jgi:hypothetical protein
VVRPADFLLGGPDAGVGMRAQLPIAVAVAALLTFVGEPASARKRPNFVTITVSDRADSVTEFRSRIKDGVVVWQKGLGASAEIMRWNGATGVDISQNGIADENPDTDGVHVVWQQSNGAQRDVAIYDLVTHVTTILTSPDDEVTPLVSGITLAWVRYVDNDLDGEVFIDPGPPGGQLTGNTLVEGSLALDGDDLVWSQGDDLHLTPDPSDDQHDIAVWNGALQGLYILGGNPTDDIHPSIAGNTVVWQAGPDGSGDIWVGDTQGSAMLLYDGTDERNPSTDGQHVVWQHWDGSDFEISLVDLATPGIMIAKTSDGYDDMTPQILGDDIVWVKNVPGDSEIWVSWHGGLPEVLNDTHHNGRADVRPRLDVDGEHFIYESCDNLGQPNELCDVVLAPEPRATLLAGIVVAMLAALAARSARRAAAASRSS